MLFGQMAIWRCYLMGLFNFFKKEKTDVEQYYEERAKREDVNGTADPYSGFRITVEDVFTITGRGTVITGKVESGKIAVGDEVTLQRVDGSSRRVVIIGIEQFRKMMDTAVAGDNVGILLRGLSRSDIGKGDILYD